MTITEIIDKVQYVTDAEGNRRAIQLDLALWETLLELLEDLEDAETLAAARQEEDTLVSWEQVKAEYRAAHPQASEGADVQN